METVEKKRSWSIPGSHFGGDPEFYSCWTLFDISNDGTSASENLEKIMAIASSRSQPILAGVEMIINQDVTNGLFGSKHTGNHNVWAYKWIVDKKGIMTEDTLNQEAHGLQLLTGLQETATVGKKIYTRGVNTNLFFVCHESL
jgi:hypothetical protein